MLKYIDVEDLVPSEDNFYPMSAIDELAGLIELSGGVKQPGLVVPLGGGKYKLLSGHRRRLASLQLVKQGKEAYRKMPCMVEDAEREPGPEAEELRAIDEEILIITTNGHTAASRRRGQELEVECAGKKIDVLPCPFCGGEPRVQSFKRNGWWHRVRCVGDCPIHPETYTYHSLDEALAVWNHRARPEEGAP